MVSYQSSLCWFKIKSMTVTYTMVKNSNNFDNNDENYIRVESNTSGTVLFCFPFQKDERDKRICKLSNDTFVIENDDGFSMVQGTKTGTITIDGMEVKGDNYHTKTKFIGRDKFTVTVVAPIGMTLEYERRY